MSKHETQTEKPMWHLISPEFELSITKKDWLEYKRRNNLVMT